MATTSTKQASSKSSKPTAAKTVEVHVAKDGERRCAARPQGPYGINAPKQCTNATRRPTAALCAVHEPMWREEARRRYAAKKGTEKVTSKRSTKAKVSAPTSDEDLEAALEASNAAFATPQLAAQARAKRKAQIS